MNQVRRSKSFLKAYMSHEQKILHKFGGGNVLDGGSSSGTDSAPSDID